jgi:hypothetical protein
MRILLLLWWLLAASAVAAETPHSIAVSDEPRGRDVEVQVALIEDAVWLRGDDCLDEKERRLVEASLLSSSRIKQVQWQLPCQDQLVRTAYRLSVEEGGVEVLPAEPLFEPLLADPREPRFSIRLQQHRLERESFTAADVALGGYLGLASGGEPRHQWELGIEGGVFALFNLDADSSDLINADYRIGIPLSYRHHDWSLRTRIYHQSSHLGDEYMLRNHGTGRRNISYEVLDALVAHDWGDLRVFAGGGYMLHTLHDQEPWQIQYGAEYERENAIGSLNFVLASYFNHTEEQDWRLNQSYRVGFTIDRGVREAGVLLAFYDGYSPDGQFYDSELRYVGLELFFRL